ncbi:MAG: hypothetical protein CMJ78_13035 [Planctomycetaceae bacterium]|nr:hypothetical protein [Planctomycetaceae bacterium]
MLRLPTRLLAGLQTRLKLTIWRCRYCRAFKYRGNRCIRWPRWDEINRFDRNVAESRQIVLIRIIGTNRSRAASDRTGYLTLLSSLTYD